MQPLEFAGQTLHLLAEGAIWWGAARTLILSDIHLGKPSAFRLGGIPVPESVTHRDLDRLDALIAATRPDRLLILGDLVHSRDWRAEPTRSIIHERLTRLAASTRIELVPGNHDRHTHALPHDLPIHIHHDALHEPPFHFTHEPSDADHPALICGHIHPVASLHTGPGGRIRAKCFWISRNRVVLPSFGSFTGGHAVRPAQDDRLFLIGPAGELFELANSAR